MTPTRQPVSVPRLRPHTLAAQGYDDPSTQHPPRRGREAAATRVHAPFTSTSKTPATLGSTPCPCRPGTRAHPTVTDPRRRHPTTRWKPSDVEAGGRPPNEQYGNTRKRQTTRRRMRALGDQDSGSVPVGLVLRAARCGPGVHTRTARVAHMIRGRVQNRSGPAVGRQMVSIGRGTGRERWPRRRGSRSGPVRRYRGRGPRSRARVGAAGG